ncbi:MAG: hypothetical protein KDA24_29960 [Deltaproteobacteria bacterium]|nr:hypothetical protein [Deltaproteobacteria bacterium]
MSDDFSFEDMMAQQGVQKMGGRKSSARRGGPAKGAAAPPARVRPSIVKVTELDAMQAERDEARAALTTTRRRVQSLEAALAKATQAEEALTTELADEREQRAAESQARAERDEESRGVRQALERQLKEATRSLNANEEARTSLADALVDRGCANEFEMMTVLNGLLLQRPRELLESIVLAEPHAIAKVLSERVALVSSGVDFTPDKNMVVLSVPKDRCEICGGSDITASFHGFVQACIDEEVDVVTVVGGSPAYRRQLKLLAEADDDAPRLNLVSGTRRREARKAQSDMRGSDVVILWGGTELDHSVSEGYRGKDARIVRIAHRGIARMLQLARSDLRRKK